MDLSSLLSPDHTVESVLTTDCRQFGVPDDFADQMNTFCAAADSGGIASQQRLIKNNR